MSGPRNRHLSALGIERPWQLLLKVRLSADINDLTPLLDEAYQRAIKFEDRILNLKALIWRKKPNGDYVQGGPGGNWITYRVTSGPEGTFLRCRPGMVGIAHLVMYSCVVVYFLNAYSLVAIFALFLLVFDMIGTSGFLRLVLKEKGLLAESTPAAAAAAK